MFIRDEICKMQSEVYGVYFQSIPIFLKFQTEGVC